jgi:hypothetical protein
VTALTVDLFGPPPKPRGSAQCPRCGRWSRIVRIGHDGAPLSAETGTYAVVDCAQHGRGEV